MEVFIKRKSDNKILRVKKYIFAEKENQQHIWCSDWYGHHIIGSDCEWVEKVNASENTLPIAVVMPDFFVENLIIENTAIKIREHLAQANPLTKPNVIDKEIGEYLVKLVNSINGA